MLKVSSDKTKVMSLELQSNVYIEQSSIAIQGRLEYENAALHPCLMQDPFSGYNGATGGLSGVVGSFIIMAIPTYPHPTTPISRRRRNLM